MADEDFAAMLRVVPGAYSPGYPSDDEIIPPGAGLLARLMEQQAHPLSS
jgi:hypothetical protein